MNENNQPQSQQTKRERGLYHVKRNGYWTVAEYTDHHGQWRVFNNTDQMQSRDFEEIDERRIDQGDGERIKELEALTDNHTSQWISVRDRLPEYMQTCIIHTSIGFVTMAQFGGGSKGKEVFVIDQEWHIADHWMPLPKFKIE